jgi:hypothetical protein
MFTGIVEELGIVASLVDLGDAARITVRGPLGSLLTGSRGADWEQQAALDIPEPR